LVVSFMERSNIFTVVGSTKVAIKLPYLFIEVFVKFRLTSKQLLSIILKEIMEIFEANCSNILLSFINLRSNTP
jgi:hypothetical protein